MRVIDKCESAPTRVTVADMLPLLLDELDARADQSAAQLQQELTALPEFEQLRLACPRIWQRALRRELRRDDPFLLMMMRNLEQVKSGTKTAQDAWRHVEEQVTNEFVTKKIGAPDQYGRPSRQ
jgi:hypothetical protein